MKRFKLGLALGLLLVVGCDNLAEPTSVDNSINQQLSSDERFMQILLELKSETPNEERMSRLIDGLRIDYGALPESDGRPTPYTGKRSLSTSYYPEGWYEPGCDWSGLTNDLVSCSLAGATVAKFQTLAGVIYSSYCVYQAYEDRCEEGTFLSGNGAWDGPYTVDPVTG